jgi:ADP-ribosyl-[dinitrogen reductase] hydrolase
MKTIEFGQVLGGLFGVCVGDALGLPVQFASRKERKLKPVTGMSGYGAFDEPPGTWSDDSSLTFCLAESLCGEYDLNDIADRFVKWRSEGYWTPFGEAFDIGVTTDSAVTRLRGGTSPLRSGDTAEECNGNGSLMRTLPLAFAVSNLQASDRFRMVNEVSAITHAHPRSLLACGMYVQTALGLLEGMTPADAVDKMKGPVMEYYGAGTGVKTETRTGSTPPGNDLARGLPRTPDFRTELSRFSRILESGVETFAALPEDDIRSSGYVVHTLEAALWCLLNARSFAETVLGAANLGGDTDTTAAVAGGLAGIRYGFAEIPKPWVEVIARKSEIEGLARRLHDRMSLASSP